MKIITLAVLLTLGVPALAFELATEITRQGNATTLETTGYAKVPLVRKSTSLTGSIVTSGILSVTGTASIVLWAKVEGAYYFSKLPKLQNVSNAEQLTFAIPFYAGEKTVTEVVIEVEMLTAGDLSLSGLRVDND